jgi:hypothetical protein
MRFTLGALLGLLLLAVALPPPAAHPFDPVTLASVTINDYELNALTDLSVDQTYTGAVFVSQEINYSGLLPTDVPGVVLTGYGESRAPVLSNRGTLMERSIIYAIDLTGRLSGV